MSPSELRPRELAQPRARFGSRAQEAGEGSPWQSRAGNSLRHRAPPAGACWGAFPNLSCLRSTPAFLSLSSFIFFFPLPLTVNAP